MTHELGKKIKVDFTALRLKMCIYVTDDIKIKKAKGLKLRHKTKT